MTQYLPPNLLALFAPRDALPYLPPADKLPHEKKRKRYNGLSAFINQFEDPKSAPPPVKVETKEERRDRKRRARAEANALKIEQALALWDPMSNSDSSQDAFKTLFISRFSFDTTESKLRREFERFGPIRKIVMVHNKMTGKSRGYAFIEFENERDMHTAYKSADGRKIEGRRVLVDVERGRTVKGWRPRRLGGGLGGEKRIPKPVVENGDDVATKDVANDKKRPPSPRRRSRERERPDRRRRSRSIGRAARGNSRDRKRRSRSKDRKRRRSRSRDRLKRRRNDEPVDAIGAPFD